MNLILHFQSPSGAYPACPKFENYKYCWFRDGSFIADSMSRAGQVESANSFFDWCANVITSRRDRIEAGQKLDTRFTMDGHEVGGEWGNFQLDGYGTWLWALKNHAKRHDQKLDKYRPAIDLTLAYLAQHWQKPCIDWWEEREGMFATTLACIYAGMSAFNHPDAEQVMQTIKLDQERLDASLLACALFNAVNDQDFAPILAEIESKLVSPSGGVYRHLDDTYYGGGEWILLTCLLGWYYLKLGRIDETKQKLDLVKAQFDNNGWLPEQASDHLLHPEQYKTWVDKWGPPATPLLWSHAMFITLASQLDR